VLAVRFTDRVGKGIRTAPRDALVAVVLLIVWLPRSKSQPQ
jgi:hypothetical protein